MPVVLSPDPPDAPVVGEPPAPLIPAPDVELPGGPPPAGLLDEHPERKNEPGIRAEDATKTTKPAVRSEAIRFDFIV
jgi:hypothetical protein